MSEEQRHMALHTATQQGAASCMLTHRHRSLSARDSCASRHPNCVHACSVLLRRLTYGSPLLAQLLHLIHGILLGFVQYGDTYTSIGVHVRMPEAFAGETHHRGLVGVFRRERQRTGEITALTGNVEQRMNMMMNTVERSTATTHRISYTCMKHPRSAHATWFALIPVRMCMCMCVCVLFRTSLFPLVLPSYTAIRRYRNHP